MKKPIILIPATYLEAAILPVFKNYATRESNTNAIEDAGGIPFVAPYWENEADIAQMVTLADGIFMAGGDDINPPLYGEEKRAECAATSPERDRFELAVIKEALKQNKPMLCICRGLQILNVAFGGTLYQDIAKNKSDDIKHPNYEKYLGDAHTVKVNKNSNLYKIMKQEELSVNSLHHQGIKDLGKGLTVVAISPDGLIEALEVPSKKYAVAYQWHPEFMLGNEQYKVLLEDFIAACQ